MSDLLITPLSVSVHRKGQNPVFGEQATHVIMDNEAAGPFLVIKQISAESRGEIRVDIDELEAVFIAGRALIDVHKARERDE